jgi:hypothetical protein
MDDWNYYILKTGWFGAENGLMDCSYKEFRNVWLRAANGGLDVARCSEMAC